MVTTEKQDNGDRERKFQQDLIIAKMQEAARRQQKGDSSKMTQTHSHMVRRMVLSLRTKEKKEENKEVAS